MLIASLFLMSFISNFNIDKPIYSIDKIAITDNALYEEIDPFIDDLYYQDKRIRDIGRKNLIKLAGKSEVLRKEVIKSLIKVVKDKKLLESQKSFRYRTWYEVVELLWILNATEAIEILIENLDYTADKKDVLFNYYPVVEFMSKISPPPFDKLEKILIESNNTTTKINVVKCLELIASDKAKELLLKALKLEKDAKTQEYIKKVLNNWARETLS
jgi:hypothetical protein